MGRAARARTTRGRLLNDRPVEVREEGTVALDYGITGAQEIEDGGLKDGGRYHNSRLLG